MTNLIALAMIGFSIVAALLLLVASATVYRRVELGRVARVCSVLALLALMQLQGYHGFFLLLPQRPFPPELYPALWFVVMPACFLLARGALWQPRGQSEAWLLLFLPALAAAQLPAAIAIPLACALGTLLAALLGRLAWLDRRQRGRFADGAITIAILATLALLILGFGLAMPRLGMNAYVQGTSILVGLGFSVALHALLRRPHATAIDPRTERGSA